MTRRTTLGLFAVTVLTSLFWASTSQAETNLLKLSPLEDGIYLDPLYEEGTAKIGTLIKNGWMQEVYVKIEKDEETIYLTGSIPIFEPKPVDIWLFKATGQFKRTSRSLTSLRLVTSDRLSITGFLEGKELVAEFQPGSEL